MEQNLGLIQKLLRGNYIYPNVHISFSFQNEGRYQEKNLELVSLVRIYREGQYYLILLKYGNIIGNLDESNIASLLENCLMQFHKNAELHKIFYKVSPECILDPNQEHEIMKCLKSSSNILGIEKDHLPSVYQKKALEETQREVDKIDSYLRTDLS